VLSSSFKGITQLGSKIPSGILNPLSGNIKCSSVLEIAVKVIENGYTEISVLPA
jgi:hypothetical protein